MDQNPQGQGHGRRHFHRGRRGPDRRGNERRAGQPPQAQEPGGRGDVDVEQIMREIRTRIAQRQGIELTNQQIQDLAARRLESILDPRSVNPALLDQLRRATGAAPEPPPRPPEPAYVFEDTTLYDSHRGLMRFIRRLLNPILKLFFNPNPLIHALNAQARLNTEAAARDAERERRQAEWNALHYELLQKVVLEISRVSLEAQALGSRVESLAAKVDFNERRVRGVEGTLHTARPATPRREPVEAAQPAAAPEAAAPEASGAVAPAAAGEGTRRRRRRRRGRRGLAGEGAAAAAEGAPLADADSDLADGSDEAGEDDEAANTGQPDSVVVAEALAVSETVTVVEVPAEPPASEQPVIAESPAAPAPPAAPPPSAAPENPAPPPDGPEPPEIEPPER